VDDAGKRWRLPKGAPALDELTGAGILRISREVVTERDLFNCHGTFYELPAENAGGFARVRPIATHNRRIVDYCSYRGMLILTGLGASPVENRHIIRSEDGRAAVWAGVVDDLWGLGKPRGKGGPWNQTKVAAGCALGSISVDRVRPEKRSSYHTTRRWMCLRGASRHHG